MESLRMNDQGKTRIKKLLKDDDGHLTLNYDHEPVEEGITQKPLQENQIQSQKHP